MAGKKILGLEMGDDLTAVSRKSADSIDVLAGRVKVLGEAFQKANVGNLQVGLTEARRLFKESGQNATLFASALKVAGTSALDTKILLGHMNSELKEQRKLALGVKLPDLTAHVKEVKEFGTSTIKIKEARKMFRAAGQDAEVFSAALKRAGASEVDIAIHTRKMSDELTRQRRAALGMEGIFKRIFDPKTIWVASHSLNVLSKSFGAVKAVAGAAGHLAGRGVEMGEGLLDSVIESAQEREDTIISMKEIFHGTKEEKGAQAEDLYAWIRKAATQTPLDTPYLIEVAKKLGEGGFHDPEEIKILTSMVADQQAKFKGDYGMNTVEALTRVKSRSFASAKDFESFRMSGFELSDIYAEMAEKMGIKEKDPLRAVAQVRFKLGHSLTDAVKGGKGGSEPESLEDVSDDKASLVNAYTLINALVSAQQKKFGQLGSFALKNSESLTGAISNFKNSFGDLLKTTDVTQWPGILALKDLMLRVQKIMLDTDGGGGKLLAGVQGAVNSLLGGLANVKDKDIESFLGKIGEFALGVAGVIKDAWVWLEKLIHSDSSFLSVLGETLIEVGAYIGAGIWKGVKGGVSGIEGARSEKKYGTDMRDQLQYESKLLGMDPGKLSATFGDSFDAFTKGGGKVKAAYGEDQAQAIWRTVTDWQKTQTVQDAAAQAGQQGWALLQGLFGPTPQAPVTGAAQAPVQVVINMPLEVHGVEDPHKLSQTIAPSIQRGASAVFARLGRE